MTTLALVEEAAGDLPFERRKMMGHDCLFAPGGIFALADGDRIGLRLADPDAYAELRGMEGAGDFVPTGGKPFAHWVIVPVDLHDEPRVLAEWVRRAHALAGVKAARKRKA